MPGVWVFPGGTVEPGEEPAAAAARELAEEAAIELPADARLVPWSRWITPEAVAIRFDTHFFVALAPPHAPPAPDGSEVTDARWIDPAEALERHGAGELELVFPTIKHLQSLLPYTSAEEVLDAAASRDLAPILPRVEGGRVVLPEGWPDI
jgi:8-oxo-dGTP pyrophosphatase MutT (NUDIX family)